MTTLTGVRASQAIPVRPITRTAIATAVTERDTHVNLVVRGALYLFVLSIPFELPLSSAPVEVTTGTAAILLLASALQPGVAWRRIPAAFIAFSVYLCVLAGSIIVHQVEHTADAFRLLLHLVQMNLVLWVVYNLLRDGRVLRGLLITLVLACVLRSGMQLFGLATTTELQWTGGERVTVLGQNTNLSAMILSAGLATVVGLQIAARAASLPRFGILAWLIAILIGAAIVQGGSRGGLLGAVLGLAVFTIRGPTLLIRIRNALLTAMGIVLLAVSAYNSPMMRGRIEGAAEGRLAGRERIYPAAFEMWRERPLLGWGPVDNEYEIARRLDTVEPPFRSTHNLLLELLTTTGIIGTIPFVIGLGFCLLGAWRARNGPLGIIPLAILVAVLTGTITGTWIAAKIVWLTLALGLAAGEHWSRVPRLPPRGAS